MRRTGQSWNPWGTVWTTTGSTSTPRVLVSGLINDDEYQFRVRGFNSSGPGAPSAPVTARPRPLAPDRPTGVTATPGDRKIALSWTNPVGGVMDHNAYRYKPASSTHSGYTDWISLNNIATSTEVTGLTNGVYYTFQVRVGNNWGPGEASAERSAWTYPAAPANLAATPGDQLVSLTWNDPANASITRYEYQRKTGGDWSATWTAVPNSGATTTRYVVDGLVNGIAYTFRLRAVSVGAGTSSAEVTATPQPVPAIPIGASAAGVSASAVGASSATVAWSYGNVALIERFQVRYRAGNEAWSAWTDVAKTQESYTVSSGLSYGTVYTFEVRAVNNQDLKSPSAQAKAATAPAAPTGLTATPGAQQATLRWDDPAYASITGWEYRQAEPKGGLTAFAGDGEVDLFWLSLASTTDIAKWQYSSDDGANWTDVPDSASTTTSYVVP